MTLDEKKHYCDGCKELSSKKPFICNMPAGICSEYHSKLFDKKEESK